MPYCCDSQFYLANRLPFNYSIVAFNLFITYYKDFLSNYINEMLLFNYRISFYFLSIQSDNLFYLKLPSFLILIISLYSYLILLTNFYFSLFYISPNLSKWVISNCISFNYSFNLNIYSYFSNNFMVCYCLILC